MKKILSKICKGIEFVDIFGKGVGIRYNKRQFHQTKLGGFATFLIWGIICYQSFSVIKELVLQEKPTIIQQINYVNQHEQFQITPKSFNIAMGFQDSTFKHYYGEGIYVLKAYQYEHKRDKNQKDGIEEKENWKVTELEVEKCTPNHFQIDQASDYFLHLPYRDLFCLKINNNIPFIEGEYTAEKYALIQFVFQRCQGSNCKSQKEIDEKLARPTLVVYFSDTYIDVKSKQNPFIQTGKNLFWATGSSMEKQIYLNLINVKIQSDFSIIGSSQDIKQALQFSSEREIALPSTSNQIFSLNITFEKNKEIAYHRSYLKAGNALSQVGGFFNFFLTIGFILFRRFSQSDLNHKLINEVFDVRDDRSENQQNQDDENKLQTQTLNSKQINKGSPRQMENKYQQSFFPSNFNSKQQNKESKSHVNDSIQIQYETNKIKTKQIRFTLLSYFRNAWRSWICCKTTESKLINYATNRIYDHIDIFNIIQKLIEVDKLKKLLLNEDQIKLFEYLPKPILFLSQFDRKQKKQQLDLNVQCLPTVRIPNKETDKNINSMAELKKSYQNINKLQNKSIVDEKIIRMIDPALLQKLYYDDMPQNLSPTPNLTLFQPNPIFPEQFDDNYDDCIIKFDEINDSIKTKELKFQQLKSMNSLKLQNISNILKIKKSDSNQIDDIYNQSIQ